MVISSGWAELPQDLLLLLMERIVGLPTFIRFGAVCREWHMLASTNKCYIPSPLLMLSETEGSDVRQFYDLSTKEVYEIPMPQAQGRKIIGSAHGWLITVGEDGEFHVLNPFSGIQIALPSRPTFQSVMDDPNPEEFTPLEFRDRFAIKATLSSDPSNGDFVVMVTHMGFNTSCLSFCGSSDKGWTNFQPLSQVGIDFAREHFFSISNAGWILKCEVSPTPRIIRIACLPSVINPASFYAVECGGELLFVHKKIWIDESGAYEELTWDGTCYHTQYFKVYKQDLEKKCLVEIKSIGDHAMFVGFNNAVCLPAASGIKKNCIYYTDDYHEGIFAEEENEGGLDTGVFCLDDGSIQPHYPGVSKSKFSLPIWIVPNLY